jgi:DNA modification methylase
MHLPTQIELRRVDRLLPFARNSRTHSDEQVGQVAASIREFGWTNPVLVGADDVIIAGHARVLAARRLGMAEVPVIVLGHLSETQRRALVLADNKLALNAGWDESLLRLEIESLQQDGFDLNVAGFSDEELRVLLADGAGDPGADDAAAEEHIPEAPANPVSRVGDLWAIGRHRLVCGDCRDSRAVAQVLDGARANVVITSPPYAAQREYDSASGFQPVPPEKYVGWYALVAANIAAFLADGGSYFLNIKPHAEDGERHLYVMDLVLAHRRYWGWRFVDEFCWRNTRNGVPGGWNNRFKNAWEPVFHFARSESIKFNPDAVCTPSDDVFEYSPANPKSESGSGLLGSGTRKNQGAGMARPSNVIEAAAESGQGSHSAPFPRALVEFFLKAFSDAGDVVLDPFMGSGTTMAAAHVLGRVGHGYEISPAYCDVILRRMTELTGEEPVLVATGQSLQEVARLRGVTEYPVAKAS